MRRVVVWAREVGWNWYNLCPGCRERLAGLRAYEAASCVFVQVPVLCFHDASDRYHVFQVTEMAREWFAWHAYGRSLCGRVGPHKPNFRSLLWLLRLFQFAAPEDREALREALAMLALAGGP